MNRAPTIPNTVLNRRAFIERLGGGLAGAALSQVMTLEAAVSSNAARLPQAAPRAKRVIQLFMNGGASQMDLFDYKPRLAREHGQKFDPGAGRRVEAATSEPGKVLASPFPFARHGASGQWVSSVLPQLARHVDELAFLLSIRSRTNVHGPGSYLLNTGFLLPGFPCLGAWVSYALGRISDNLPSFVVLPDSKGLPYNQKGNFSAGFLPVAHQGTIIQAGAKTPIANLAPPTNGRFITPAASAEGLALLKKVNQHHLRATPADARLEARIETYELAAKMQLSAPEAFDLSTETAATKALYGLENPASEDFGRRCLLGRRLLERGVRFVQVWSGQGGPTGNWDNHVSISKELPPIAASTDQPIAGLLTDLKARGLLEDTLVLWNTEFGRMPFSQSGEGRDHNGGTSSGWMAGAGVRPGVAVGASDDWSWQAAEGSITSYDFHATVLHLLGLDHKHVSVRHDGAERRLTDVHGEVVTGVLA